MKQLIATARNIIAAKQEKKCFAMAELIFVISETKYGVIDKEGKIGIEQKIDVEEIRIAADMNAIAEVITELQKVLDELIEFQVKLDAI